jgi:hypothetical protein
MNSKEFIRNIVNENLKNDGYVTFAGKGKILIDAIKKTVMYLYHSHNGGFFITDEPLSEAQLHCECGESDRFVGTIKYGDPIESVYELINKFFGVSLCDWAGCEWHLDKFCKGCPLFNNASGYGKGYVMEILSQLFSEDEIEAFFAKLIKEKLSAAKKTEEPDMKHLYIDMDGVIALWDDYYKYALEDMKAEGFFENLEPNISLVRAVKTLISQYGDIDIHILSAVMNENSKAEKNAWLDKYLPEIKADKRHFTRYGTNKADVFKDSKKPWNYVLLDDYTKNLRQWAEAGGKGICLLNGENSPSGKWRGDYVYYKTAPDILARTLHALCHA